MINFLPKGNIEPLARMVIHCVDLPRRAIWLALPEQI
uniref:Uncharacterized protein n=1 Tax=Anguilla anguilla TaxID=7936 RepID=A0A0E9P773_ANGAN